MQLRSAHSVVAAKLIRAPTRGKAWVKFALNTDEYHFGFQRHPSGWGRQPGAGRRTMD
jgi:hypothetical protein